MARRDRQSREEHLFVLRILEQRQRPVYIDIERKMVHLVVDELSLRRAA